MPYLLAAFLFLASIGCSTVPRLQSPVDLKTAILTLPADAVAGMSAAGRKQCLVGFSVNDLFDVNHLFDEVNRRFHFVSDGPDGGDAESMFYLKLLEDDHGRTVAASHAARPRANGSKPSRRNTVAYRLENGRWIDRSNELLPDEVPKEWYYFFSDPGKVIPCGPYVYKLRSDGREFYSFGEPEQFIRWENSRFHLTTNGEQDADAKSD